MLAASDSLRGAMRPEELESSKLVNVKQTRDRYYSAPAHNIRILWVFLKSDLVYCVREFSGSRR